MIELVALFVAHLRDEFTIHAELVFQLVRALPEADGQTGQEGGAHGGGLDAGRTHHRGVHHVGLELHQEVVGHGAAVYLEGSQLEHRGVVLCDLTTDLNID